MTNDMRKLVLLMAIGVCEAIEKKALSINESQHYLFSPRTMKIFATDSVVRDIIHEATEFEDLASLVPSALDNAIAEVKRKALIALQMSPPCDYEEKFWVDKIETF